MEASKGLRLEQRQTQGVVILAHFPLLYETQLRLFKEFSLGLKIRTRKVSQVDSCAKLGLTQLRWDTLLIGLAFARNPFRLAL